MSLVVLALIQAFHGSAGYPVGYPTRRRPRTPSPPPEPDQERGNELLNSGEFGRVSSAYVPPRENKRNVARRLWMRELKPRSINPLALGEVSRIENRGHLGGGGSIFTFW